MPSQVSIVMPCLNAGTTLPEAISSVLAQEHEDFELLVIDDGSTDDSAAITKRFCESDPRVKLFINNGQLHGASAARNVGLAAAKGSLIAFLDSDDTWFPWALGDRVERLRESGAPIVYGPYLRRTTNGTAKEVIPQQVVTYKDMLLRNHIANLTGLYDATALGIEYQDNVPHEDYLMWCKLLSRGLRAVSTTGRPLGTYRVSPNSLSGNKGKAFLWHWEILRTGLNVPLYKAIPLQMYYAIDAIAQGRLRN